MRTSGTHFQKALLVMALYWKFIRALTLRISDSASISEGDMLRCVEQVTHTHTNTHTHTHKSAIRSNTGVNWGEGREGESVCGGRVLEKEGGRKGREEEMYVYIHTYVWIDWTKHICTHELRTCNLDLEAHYPTRQSVPREGGGGGFFRIQRYYRGTQGACG